MSDLAPRPGETPREWVFRTAAARAALQSATRCPHTCGCTSDDECPHECDCA